MKPSTWHVDNSQGKIPDCQACMRFYGFKNLKRDWRRYINKNQTVNKTLL